MQDNLMCGLLTGLQPEVREGEDKLVRFDLDKEYEDSEDDEPDDDDEWKAWRMDDPGP